MTEDKENCSFQQNYNVFGLDDKPCCYLYHKYCDEIDNCYFKRCKCLEQENERLKKEIEDLNFYIDSYRQVWEVDKYRSALEEIREINNKWLKRWRDDSDELVGFEEIENKINEVLK